MIHFHVYVMNMILVIYTRATKSYLVTHTDISLLTHVTPLSKLHSHGVWDRKIIHSHLFGVRLSGNMKHSETRVRINDYLSIMLS